MRFLRSSSLVFAAALLGLGLTACGGANRGISVGTMPEGGTFHGVWHSLQYGEMHFCQSGKHVIGTYTKDERQGHLQGDVEGDIFFFDWTEERVMVVGRPTVTRGRGYFRLRHEEDDHWYLDGEWGLDDARRGGGRWLATRLERRQPERCYEGVRRAPEGEDALPDDSTGADASQDDF
jgi:hypothetical protein